MSLPKHDEIRLPALKLLKAKGKIKLREFIQPLGEHFKLSDEDLNQMYQSGNGPIFYDRVSWALSYLNMGGLVDKPKRGTYEINSKGIELIEKPDQIDKFIDKEIEKREPKKEKKKSEEQIEFNDTSSELTPQEKLYSSFSSIKKSVYTDIINTILTKTPIAFEKLVVSLLQKMGYGGEIQNSGLVTKASNDGGIDGIITEDVLGLGRIHIQAKRYKTDISIGREEIQKFVGALAVAQSNKGVFITTSTFDDAAIKKAREAHHSIILIDGAKLVDLMHQYNVGVQIKTVYEVKELDNDFFEGE